jgi:type IV pilus assembly protein PilY1
MSSAFPELRFPVKDGNGRTIKAISVFPVNSVGSGNWTFLNYFVLDWDVDRNGQTFKAQIKVNFSDAKEGGDWEGDGQVTYTFQLLTNNSTPLSMREKNSVNIDSGDSSVARAQLYYTFRNPSTADSREDFIEILPSQVKAFLITSSWSVPGTTVGMAMGYTISGTTRDNTYFDLTMNTPPALGNLTPPGCQYVGGSSSGKYGCGTRVKDLKSQSRIFAFKTNAKDVGDLPNPLWLAAKYGGFNDLNRNGVPDAGEWEGEDGNPKNYFQSTNIAELPQKIETAFKSIAKSLSTGVATSASVNSVLEGGVSVQSVYYPVYSNPLDSSQNIVWGGGLYGLFVDKFGNLREDSDGDQALTLLSDSNGASGDNVVTFSSVKTPMINPPACYSFGNYISRCKDVTGENRLVMLTGSNAHPKDIHKLKPLFDTGKWLASLDSSKVLSGNRPYDQPATISQGRRLIYYGQPSLDGDVTLAPFTSQDSTDDLSSLMLSINYTDFLPGATEMTKEETTKTLIEYVAGVDFPLWRSRTVGDPWSDNTSPVVWRLGDIINSKPIIVGAPNFAYNLIYGDRSYLEFRQKMASRRQMVYVGANDGMLHAINLGFFGSLERGRVHYTTTSSGSESAHELGAEVWAYIPTSVLPHLQFLADPEYLHGYFVDLKPMISDIKINGKWRTVLFGGLRLGGRPISSQSADQAQGPHFFSEIFALDVTDPEKPPILLWRYSSLSLGLTVGLPAIIQSGGEWYAVLASGPVSDKALVSASTPYVEYGELSPYQGHSNQRAKLIVLKAATGEEVVQTDPKKGGDPNFLTVSENNSFFTDPFVPIAQIKSNPWNNHAIYYGLTVSRDSVSRLDTGAVYRLQMVDLDGQPLAVNKWKIRRLFNTERPVSGAVNSAYDKKGALWVVFGTGRLWGFDDLNPCLGAATTACQNNHKQYLYGIKEELNKNGLMTFKDRTAEANKLVDVSGAKVYNDGRVINIKSQYSLLPFVSGGSTNYAALFNAFLKPEIVGYKRLLDIGTTFTPSSSHNYEMIVTQPKIVAAGGGNSLTVFTSFEPSSESCFEVGYGYQYMVDTFTGLPQPQLYPSFINAGAGLNSDGKPPKPGSPAVVTGAMAIGEGPPTEAIVIKVGEKTIIRSSGPDGGVYDLQTPESLTLGSKASAWREVRDLDFELPPEVMDKSLP